MMKDEESASADAVPCDDSFSLHNLEDVFASDTDPSTGASAPLAPGNSEYSDLPYLKRVHEIDGYRHGIIRGKIKSSQKGVDQGYKLGAMLGLRAGIILGILEGIDDGIQPMNERQEDEEPQRVQCKPENEDDEIVSGVATLWQTAKNELVPSEFFETEGWDENSYWWDKILDDTLNKRVNDGDDGEDDARNGGSRGDDRTNLALEDLVKSHPLMKKWQKLVENEVRKWKIDLNIFDKNFQDIDNNIHTESGEEKAENWSDQAYKTPIDSLSPNLGPSTAPDYLSW